MKTKNETKTNLDLLELLTTNPTAAEVEAILFEALAAVDDTEALVEREIIEHEMWNLHKVEKEYYETSLNYWEINDKFDIPSYSARTRITLDGPLLG